VKSREDNNKRPYLANGM